MRTLDSLVGGLIACVAVAAICWRSEAAWTPAEPRAETLRPVLPRTPPSLAAVAVPSLSPPPIDFEAMRVAMVEAEMRAACAREEGAFSWSGDDVDAMRCWRRRGDGPSLHDELVFEVDP